MVKAMWAFSEPGSCPTGAGPESADAGDKPPRPFPRVPEVAAGIRLGALR